MTNMYIQWKFPLTTTAESRGPTTTTRLVKEVQKSLCSLDDYYTRWY